MTASQSVGCGRIYLSPAQFYFSSFEAGGSLLAAPAVTLQSMVLMAEPCSVQQG